ncbi:alpha/beta fold hydrolase [Streptomyces buecherae]|uniref:alpha/beta fold hydrolase n=1 Tax=Streptomyces buecherae TaxID=2763006 RepID=UPI00369C485D
MGLVRRAVMALVARGRVPAVRITEMLGRLPYDPGVRRDFRKLMRGLRTGVTRAVARELNRFPGRVLVVWSGKDPLFPFDHGRRLAACFARGSVVVAERPRAFVSLDEPDWLAERIVGFVAGGEESHDAP